MTSTTAPPGVAATRLERPAHGRMVAGVAGGIARHLNVDPVLARLGFALAVLAGGFGVVAYVAGWLLIPAEGADKPIVHAGHSRSAGTIAGVVLLVVGGLMAMDSVAGGHIFGHLFWTVGFLGAGAWLLLRSPEDNRRVSPPAVSPDAPTEVAPAPPAPPAPRGRSGTRVVAGVMLIVAGVLSALFVFAGVAMDWREVAALAVIAAGATLAVGAFFGASAWLAGPPLALAAAVAGLGAAGVELEGPIGDRHWSPALASDLPAEYRMAIGEMEIDLGATRFAPGSTTELHAQLGMGELSIRVPSDVEVQVDAHAGAGEVRLPGGGDDGTDVSRAEVLRAQAGAPVLILEADVGFGELRVERDGIR